MLKITDRDYFALIRAQIDDPPPGETSLHAFMRLFWREVDPRLFKDGWHLHAKCEVLEHVSRGEIKQLVINEPPNSCKSKLCNVVWPAWHWAKHAPHESLLFASYEAGLAHRDAQEFLDLLGSKKFRGVFPEFKLTQRSENEKKAIGRFANGHRGVRMSVSTGQPIIGHHFDVHVYDDLIKPQSILEDVASEHQNALKKADEWIHGSASTRAKDSDNLRRVVIAQRLHEVDPSGILLKEGGWEHLCFLEEHDPSANWIVGDLTKKYEKRTERGQLLWPERRSPQAVASLKKALRSPAAISAQLQQNPTPASGSVLSARDFERHYYLVKPNLSQCRLVASFDLSFKSATVEQSRVAWQLWAQLEDREYLIDAGADWLDYSASKAKIRELLGNETWKKANVFLIEDKANGPALLSDLQGEFRQLTAYEPGNTELVARMLPFVDRVRTGAVAFPDPSIAPWVSEIVAEIARVPRGAHDDHWATMAQALAYIRSNSTNYSQALKMWRQRGRL